jgi:hypothetical protein
MIKWVVMDIEVGTAGRPEHLILRHDRFSERAGDGPGDALSFQFAELFLWYDHSFWRL